MQFGDLLQLGFETRISRDLQLAHSLLMRLPQGDFEAAARTIEDALTATVEQEDWGSPAAIVAALQSRMSSAQSIEEQDLFFHLLIRAQRALKVPDLMESYVALRAEFDLLADTEALFLVALLDYFGPMRPETVVNISGFGFPDVSRIITKLLHDGLLSDSIGQRGYTLTSKGKSVLALLDSVGADADPKGSTARPVRD